LVEHTHKINNRSATRIAVVDTVGVRGLEERLALLARSAARGREGVAFGVEKLAGQASNRTYYRVAAPGGPSFVAMVMAPDAKRSEEATSGPAPAELPFLNVHRYLARLGIPVPALHANA